MTSCSAWLRARRVIQEPSWSWTRVVSPAFCSTSISGRRGTKPISWRGSSCSLAQSQLLVELGKSLKVTQGLMMSSTAVPRCCRAALSRGTSCLRSPANERATKVAPAAIASRQRSNGGTVFSSPVCAAEVGVEVGGGRELALGQAVAAVVLDDVDHRQVAPAGVLELADADVGRVAVAADADAQRARGWPATAPVATEGMRPCRALKPWLYWRK